MNPLAIGLRVRVERQMWRDGVGVYLYEKQQDGKIFMHVPTFQLKAIEPAMYYPDFGPTVDLPAGAAQELFDELWRSGFRPKNGESSLAHVDAMREHLKDMQRIVFRSYPAAKDALDPVNQAKHAEGQWLEDQDQ